MTKPSAQHATRREWNIRLTALVVNHCQEPYNFPDYVKVREVLPGDRKALREAFVTCYPMMSGCSDAADRFIYELEKRGILPEGSASGGEK